MDTNKKQNKGTGRGGAAEENSLAGLQQQMALAAQLGLPMDPATLQNLGAPSDLTLQRMLAMQASGLPLMDPGAALAFGGLGGFPSSGMPSGLLPGNMGGPNWMAMAAQQAQLLSMFGGGLPPAMLNQLLGAGQGNLGNRKTAPSHKDSSSRKRQSPAHFHKESSRPDSNASTSRLTPSDMLSPGSSSQARASSKPAQNSSPPHAKDKGIRKEFEAMPKNQAETEEMIQREMMKQMEQQFMFQQLQLKQQQDQIHAALSAINLPTERQPSGSLRSQREDTSQSDKLQQQLSQSIYQQLLASTPGLPGVASSMPPYFGSHQAMEQLMGLSQGKHPTSSTNFNAKPTTPQQFSRKPPVKQTSPSPHARTKVKKDASLPDPKNLPTLDQRKNIPPPFFGGASSNSFTDDPSNEIFLAAIFDQLHQQGMAGWKNDLPNSGERKREQTNAHVQSGEEFTPLDKLGSSFKDTSIKQEQSNRSSSSAISPRPPAADTSHRRRKQANPTSISGISKTDARPESNRMKNGERCFSPSARNSNPPGTERGPDVPVALVKSRPDQKSQHKPSTEGLNLQRSDRDLPNEKHRFVNQSNDKCRSSTSNVGGNPPMPPSDAITEKDLVAAMAAMASEQDKLGMPRSLEGMDKVILSAYNNLLAGGQPNKINDLLTATVAAEMGRLQTQQITLTRELEMIRKQGEPRKEGEAKAQLVGKDGGETGPFLKAEGVAAASHRIDSISPQTKGLQSTSFSATDSERRRGKDLSKEEEAAMIPLDRGWMREVHFQHFNNELSGKVCYVSPEGKKMKTFEDILKYVDDNDVMELQRDNFSFDPRLRVGTFYEQKGDSKEWTEIPKDELEQVWSLLRHGGSLFNKLPNDISQLLSTARKLHCETAPARGDPAKRAIEDKLRREADERTKQTELKLRQIEEQTSRTKLFHQQKTEQQRQERQSRERQLLEEAARQLAKYQEAVRKTKEREQRRQHLVLLKALETKRRAEERDRRKEEIKNERMFIREKKMEQRQLAMKLARELKMPVEDMCLKNHQKMPKLEPLQGTEEEEGATKGWSQLSGAATADVLMVLEFLYTFKDAIFIDENVIPTFKQLQRGLLNDAQHVEYLVQLTMALLHQCLCDPGVPAPGPWLHSLVGIKVTDLDVSKGNYSEILRLFLWARNGTKTEVAKLLETEPFPSLTPDQKAGTLAFMVNELVCSTPICADIEKHLDNLVTLRRDKWVVEGKIRQARIEEANAGSDASSPSKSVSKHKIDDDAAEEKMEKDDSSKDDDSTAGETKPKCRSDTLIQRKMKKLTKEHQSFNERMYRSSKPLRSLEIGQDRYKRRFWVLSHLGGIYVEGLESGLWYDNEEEEEQEKEIKEETKKFVVVKQEAIEPATVLPDQSNLMCLSEAALLRSNMEKAAKSEIKLNNDTSDVQPIIDPKLNNTSEVLQTSNSSGNPLVPTMPSTLHFNGHDGHINVQSAALNKTNSQNEIIQSLGHTLVVTSSCHSSTNTEVRPNSTPPATSVPPTSVSASAAPPKAVVNNAVKTETLPLKSDLFVPNAAQNDTGCVARTREGISHCSATSSSTNLTSSNDPINPNATPTDDLIIATAQERDASSHVDSGNPNLNPIMDASDATSDTKSEISREDGTSLNITYASDLHSKVSSQNPSSQTQREEQSENMNDTDSKAEKEEDSVEAAARAIAAKAVASTSHLLFPQTIKSNCDVTASFHSASSSTEGDKAGLEKGANNKTGKDTLTLESVFESIPGLSSHMAKALQSIGIDATNLSQQQLQALMHIKNNEGLVGFVPKGNKATGERNSSTLNCISEDEPKTKVTTEQESPIDLSKPAATTDPSPSKPTPKPPQPPPIAKLPGIKPLPLDDPLFRGNPLAHMFDPTMIMMSKFNPIIKAEFERTHPPSGEAINIKPKDVKDKPTPVPKELKRGWWKISSEEQLDAFCERLHSRGMREKHLHRSILKHRRYCVDAMGVASSSGFQFANGPESNKETKSENEEPSTESRDSSSEENMETTPNYLAEEEEEALENPTQTAYMIEMEGLRQVEELADRCLTAGILGQSWKTTPKASVVEQDLAHVPYQCPDESMKHDWSAPIRHDPNSVLGFAVDLLTRLELSILRMYLKPPLIRKGGSTEFSSLPSLSEAGADVAAGLRTWRNAVATATSGAQLSMCTSTLESCIAWERTVKCATKVESSPKAKKKRTDKRPACKSPATGPTKKKKTQKPGEGANLVDSEDSNPQTPLHDVEAVSANKKSVHKKSGAHALHSLNDDDYPSDDSAPHGDKLQDSPLSLEKHASNSCHGNDSGRASEGNTAGAGEGDEKLKKKKQKSKRKNKEKDKPDKPKKKKTVASSVRELLLDLQEHEMATWFLFPVDLKLVPDYKKFIKRPMDFSLIESRMKRGRYKTGEQFAEEVRIIFDNCQLFNEDDSPIGRAGHAMRSYFEDKWSELEKDLDMSEEFA